MLVHAAVAGSGQQTKMLGPRVACTWVANCATSRWEPSDSSTAAPAGTCSRCSPAAIEGAASASAAASAAAALPRMAAQHALRLGRGGRVEQLGGAAEVSAWQRSASAFEARIEARHAQCGTNPGRADPPAVLPAQLQCIGLLAAARACSWHRGPADGTHRRRRRRSSRARRTRRAVRCAGRGRSQACAYASGLKGGCTTG